MRWITLKDFLGFRINGMHKWNEKSKRSKHELQEQYDMRSMQQYLDIHIRLHSGKDATFPRFVSSHTTFWYFHNQKTFEIIDEIRYPKKSFEFKHRSANSIDHFSSIKPMQWTEFSMYRATHAAILNRDFCVAALIEANNCIAYHTQCSFFG